MESEKYNEYEECVEEVKAPQESAPEHTSVQPNTMNPEQMGIFEKFLALNKTYGFSKVMFSAIAFVFFSLLIYLAFNPGFVFEKYDRYESNKHAELIEYRMQSSPLIRNYLNQVALETGANKAYIIEYHNGKSNPSGMQWQYGDMTFISDNAEDVRDEFQNISLVKYPIFYELYENVIWMGNLEELECMDKRYSARLAANDVQFIGYTVLYGSNLQDLGILGLSFNNESCIDKNKIRQVLRKYSTTISPLLDAKKALENKKKVD